VNSVQSPTYQAGMDARFAIAARHSRMVRVLRIAVPAAVILAMTAIIAVSIFNPFRLLLPKLPLDVGNLVVSGTKITMESPHLSGYTPDRRPYELWANTATQDLTDPDHLDLKTLRAKFLMEDRTTVTLDARNGLFDTKEQLLELQMRLELEEVSEEDYAEAERELFARLRAIKARQLEALSQVHTAETASMVIESGGDEEGDFYEPGGGR